jgi:hypothetical protein
MAETAAELKERLKRNMQADTVSDAPAKPDRFIKGTLLDDHVIEFIQKFATILLIVAMIGLIWLWAERSLGVRTLQPYRVWLPSIYMIVMMFWIKPFLRLGWLGWGFVIVQSINLSGYFFQAIQGITGVR